MAKYYSIHNSTPLREAGLVEFASEDPISIAILEDTLKLQSAGHGESLKLRYENDKQLLRLISSLQRQLKPENALAIQCRISKEDEATETEADSDQEQPLQPLQPHWFPLQDLFGEVGERSVADYILHHLFTTYLQPIVQPHGNVMGYELLLRPLPELSPFRPALLFETARQVGQHSFLDRAATLLSIRLGAAYLPPGIKRFINFLPSSLHCPIKCLNSTFEAMKNAGTDPRDYVFEVIESERLDDPRLPRVFEIYRGQGVRLALDDVGAGFATLEVVERLQPDYVKMDRRWVSGCENDSDKQRYINMLMERVSAFHGVLLAEGVERQEEWDYLRSAGVPLFQGYLFGRAMPVPLEASAALQQ